VIKLVEQSVTCYRATLAGSPSCTVGNTRQALRQLEKKGRARQEALELLGSDRAAVDYTTLGAIQNLANAARNGEAGAKEILLKAARKRDAELQEHPRVVTEAEPLRFFCGVLREIYRIASAHLEQPVTSEEAWRLCRRFALAIFEAANVERHHFLAHPERLTEYLQTDVTVS
jgi:hypothetical protein